MLFKIKLTENGFISLHPLEEYKKGFYHDKNLQASF